MMLKFFLPILCAVLVGCSGSDVKEPESGSHAPQGKTLVYECTGYDFVARQSGAEMAVWLEDRYLVLSEVESTSADEYRAEDVVFRSVEHEATLSIGAQSFGRCKLAASRVPWEDARLRGVSFRATGNEPGWYLEIQSGHHLLFVGAYGMNRLQIADPGQQVVDGAVIYHAVTEGHDVRVEIAGRSCGDSMSGAIFPNQVQVRIDGKFYRGCGRYLESQWQ